MIEFLICNLRIVMAEGSANQTYEITAAVETSLGEAVSIEVHDPDNPDLITYLAADEEAEAIYLNRFVVDADVVMAEMILAAQGGGG